MVYRMGMTILKPHDGALAAQGRQGGRHQEGEGVSPCARTEGLFSVETWGPTRGAGRGPATSASATPDARW